jgi:MFS family permease
MYLVAFFIAIQLGVVLYSSSSFLSISIAENKVGLIYSIAALISAVAILCTPLLLRHISNYHLLQLLLWINCVLLAIIAWSGWIILTLISILIYLVLARLIPLSLDIFLEDGSEDRTTGNTRGIYLTAINLGILVSPLLLSLLLANEEYWKVFAAASLLTLPVSFFTAISYRRFKNPDPDPLNLRAALAMLRTKPDILRISISATLLFTFYSWIIVYTPIYLNRHIGFGWHDIGIMYTIMLLPFILLEIPLGRIADGYLGEKELLIYGFVITGLATAAMSLIGVSYFWIWTGVLFSTRVGASIIEIMCETYFFKQISSRDTHFLSIYRLSQPAGYIIGPILASLALILVDIRFIFAILGLIMLTGVIFAKSLTDTK